MPKLTDLFGSGAGNAVATPSNTRPALSEIGFLRERQVLALIPISRAGWWNGVKSGIYPRGYKLSPGVTAWKVEDILSLIERLGKQS